MASVPVPHTALAAVGFTDPAGDSLCEATFYWRDNTDAIFTNPATFATQVWNAWVANVVPNIISLVVSNKILFEDQRTVPYGGAVFPQAATPGGQAAGAGASNTSSSFALKRLTGTLGRSGRGRLYLPIWANGQQNGLNTISAAQANAFVLDLANFQAAVEGGLLPCKMVLVSRQTNKLPNNPAVVRPVVGWAYSDLILDNQRRRLPGRGA